LGKTIKAFSPLKVQALQKRKNFQAKIPQGGTKVPQRKAFKRSNLLWLGLWKTLRVPWPVVRDAAGQGWVPYFSATLLERLLNKNPRHFTMPRVFYFS